VPESYENDISAEEKTARESSWIPFQNEHCWWKKSFSSKKSKRKKEIIRIGRMYVAFSSMPEKRKIVWNSQNPSGKIRIFRLFIEKAIPV